MGPFRNKRVHVRKCEAHSYCGRPARQLPSANHLGALAGGTPAVHLRTSTHVQEKGERSPHAPREEGVYRKSELTLFLHAQAWHAKKVIGSSRGA